MIVELDAEATVLTSTITSVPDAQINVVDVSLINSDQMRVALWVSGCAFDELETAFERDETIDSFKQITSTDSQRLYRITPSNTTPDVAAYKIMVANDGVPIRITHDGVMWNVKAQFPSRSDYTAFKREAAAHGMRINEHAVHSDDQDGYSQYYGLTQPQRETLIAAIELGYFSIPRDASLATLAEHLDISPNAASERLRRAIETLIQNTIIRDRVGSTLE